LYGIAFGIAAAGLTDEAIAQYDGIGVLRVEYNGKFRTTRHELAALTSLGAGFHSEVTISYALDDGAIVMRVELTEKWPLILILFATYADQSLTLGFNLLDSDFPGSLSTLASRVFWSTTGWMAHLSYFDRRIGGSDVAFAFSSAGGKTQRRMVYADGSPFSSSTYDFMSGGATADFWSDRDRPFIGSQFQWLRPGATAAVRQ
jgi:hypothetical protein